MSTQAPTSDADLMDLLRRLGPMGVAELASAMAVTPTAIRQRLTRLMARNAIRREAIHYGRGRPKHRYSLVEVGQQPAGT